MGADSWARATSLPRRGELCPDKPWHWQPGESQAPVSFPSSPAPVRPKPVALGWWRLSRGRERPWQGALVTQTRTGCPWLGLAALPELVSLDSGSLYALPGVSSSPDAQPWTGGEARCPCGAEGCWEHPQTERGSLTPQALSIKGGQVPSGAGTRGPSLGPGSLQARGLCCEPSPSRLCRRKPSPQAVGQP